MKRLQVMGYYMRTKIFINLNSPEELHKFINSSEVTFELHDGKKITTSKNHIEWTGIDC